MKTKRTNGTRSPEKAQPAVPDPREAALAQAQHDTAGFQKKAAKRAVEAEHTRIQARKSENAAREPGTDQDGDRLKGVPRTLARPDN